MQIGPRVAEIHLFEAALVFLRELLSQQFFLALAMSRRIVFTVDEALADVLRECEDEFHGDPESSSVAPLQNSGQEIAEQGVESQVT